MNDKLEWENEKTLLSNTVPCASWNPRTLLLFFLLTQSSCNSAFTYFTTTVFLHWRCPRHPSNVYRRNALRSRSRFICTLKLIVVIILTAYSWRVTLIHSLLAKCFTLLLWCRHLYSSPSFLLITHKRHKRSLSSYVIHSTHAQDVLIIPSNVTMQSVVFSFFALADVCSSQRPQLLPSSCKLFPLCTLLYPFISPPLSLTRWNHFHSLIITIPFFPHYERSIPHALKK